MNYLQKEAILSKLKALTDGPTPLLFRVEQAGEFISVHIQPWGNPIYINYSQAQSFLGPMPLQMPIKRKSVASEIKTHHKVKHG